jgi:membrane-bound ClpP family serine protease
MTRKSLWSLLAIVIAGLVPATADTFKNKETGEIFYGFRTQKSIANKTLVYNEATSNFLPLDLRGYEITMDDNGRRPCVVVVPITAAEVLLSETVAKTVADAIIKASNTGPKFILLKIDNPGGRGEYMKELCSAISKTDNCKIAAYIAGGPYSGAHSAAALLALACDKVFVAPTASISAISPLVGTASIEEFVETYSDDSLASFSVFAATLAETQQRPALFAKALLDKKIALVEVEDANGKRSVVEKDVRQPSQTVIKTICEGFSVPQEQSASDKTAKTTLPPDIHNRVLNLTPTEAVRFKLADKIIDSIQGVLAEMNASDAQLANAPGIDTTVKQFVAARKNIRQNLSQIEFLENRTATLEEQFNSIEQQIRTTPATRTQTRYENRSNQRGRVYLSNTSGTYSDSENRAREKATSTNNENRLNRNQNRLGRINNSETVTSAEPTAAVEQIRVELSYVLVDLVSEYRQTITLAKRWAGALPAEVTTQALERNMNSAIALSDNLRYRQLGTNNTTNNSNN